MDRAIALFFRFLEVVLVLLLFSMVVMVFGNVVLRYGFNRGIVISEEMSRYFFVWLTFIGAVVTFREGSHLGVESLVRTFGPIGRRICLVLTDVIIIFCCAVLFWGTWKQAPINASMVAPVTGLPMIFVNGVAFFTAIGIGLIAFARLLRSLTGRLAPGELQAFAGERLEVDSPRMRGE